MQNVFYYIVNEKNELYCLQLDRCPDWNEEKFFTVEAATEPYSNANNLIMFKTQAEAQKDLDENMACPVRKNKANWHLCKILEFKFGI